MNTSGDGFLAMFDGPQRAIRCAMAIRDAVQALGIEVRAGLHTGECEVRGDDIGGIAVHIGARVSALAGPNDVLVSSTLRDLVIGSGLEFEDRGDVVVVVGEAAGASGEGEGVGEDALASVLHGTPLCWWKHQACRRLFVGKTLPNRDHSASRSMSCSSRTQFTCTPCTRAQCPGGQLKRWRESLSDTDDEEES